MKSLIALPAFVFLFSTMVHAEEGKAILHERELPAVTSPGFKEPLDATWSIAKGTWTPDNGILKAVELPDEKHVAVLHHKVGLESATIDCEFKMDGPDVFIIGCDGVQHVGRVVVTSGGLSIAEDFVKPSHTIATLKFPVKEGEWHRLHVEWQGDEMAARLDGQELRAKNPYLVSPKAQSWLAVAKTASVRALSIRGVTASVKP
jgi:hypothetical protein